ncbi:MAG: phosphatase PAP2 family protein, partial [Leadbetterella sp.]
FYSLFSGVLLSSCDDTVSENVFEAYVPSNVDATAGTWKTYILTSASQIAVPQPKAITDPTYIRELDSLKNQVLPNLTQQNKDAIAYWGVGAVYRWNEIARELAAKYNVPPASNEAGIYPVPDAANPLKDPKFPFANPPYTARALAYLSVAQYDALVSTWKYKYDYKRMSPAGVNKLLPESNIPSYPSEDAVVGMASYTILAAMFPGEVPYLAEKLKECKNARLWAGIQVQSDITAGEALGKSVGDAVMAKVRTDGMGAANNQTLVPAQIEAAKGRGISTTWVSQEIPARPPMLPNYGAVATWNFDRKTLESMRPKLPYIANSTEWKKEYEELSKVNSSQTREQARIANYWSDGAGSYTPPGHWHRIASDECYAQRYSPVRTARTLAMIGTAIMDAGIACWETKYYYYTPRPQQFGLKTSVGLPNFPSYTSGHSTFSSAAATVLTDVFPSKKSTFEALAKEASDSRVFGLIHFRVDCEMGLDHGKKIGEYAVKRGKADGSGL